jgi:Transglycosylase-like domain
MSATVGLTLVTTAIAAVVVPAGPVAADQVSNLKTQATQIAQDLVLEQLQISTYHEQYDVDVATVERDQAEIRHSEDQIKADAERVRRDRARLQADAVSAYVNSGSQLDGTLAMFQQNQTKALARTEYEEVASGDISLAIAALHTDAGVLNAERSSLEQQETRDQATTNQEATVTSAARQTEGQLASKQSEVTGELAVAVAQQQAAQAAAAAAAVKAAQAAAVKVAQAAASRATTTTTQTATASSPAPAGQVIAVSTSSSDPSLPSFLQCVLQAESSGNYAAVSPGGTYLGGFQFSQPTWNEAAQLAGMPQLVNVPPNQATPAQQDDLAIALYQADGQQPWNDSCRNG